MARATVEQLDAGLRERVMIEVAAAPGWLHHDAALFVHGGFHTAMLASDAPEHGLERPRVHWHAPCTASPPGAFSRMAIPSAACAGWTAFLPG